MSQNDNQPSANRRTQHKTELCLRFQRGTCDYGDRCCFAHGYEELRGFDKRQEPIPVDEVSRVKHRDENQNTRCTDTSRLCWRFMNGEICQFGDKCHFNHIKTERTSVAISVVNVAGNGESQQQKRTPWRTRLCNRWMSTGSCPYGLRCCFAHGESELQKQGSKDARDYTEKAPELISKTFEKNGDRKHWEFKWKNIEKISRVYADWINDSPLVHVETVNPAS